MKNSERVRLRREQQKLRMKIKKLKAKRGNTDDELMEAYIQLERAYTRDPGGKR
jgi:hypothetical protein